MNFISFIRNLPQQDDPGLNGFLTIAKSDPDFPGTSDPLKLAKYIYLKLSPENTLGFQKSLMIYFQLEPTNQIPPKYKNSPDKFLEAINFILKLQDNDPMYPFAHLLPKNRGK